jgi:hypothetical protein
VKGALVTGRLQHYSSRMEPTPKAKSLFILWVVANSIGWVLGVIVVVMLGTLGEVIHIGHAVYVGAGMGLTVGLAQWLTARKWFGTTSRWMWATMIGITAPFLFADLVRIGDLGSSILPVLAAIGGLLSGWMQRSSLLPRSSKANRWVIVSAIAWMCPALLVEFVAVPRHPQTTLESVRNIGSIAFGGVALGVITGLALASPFGAQERSVSQQSPDSRNR